VCPSPRRSSKLPQHHQSALFDNTKLTTPQTLSIINDLGGRRRSGSIAKKTPANPYFRYVFAGA
jgi:hypothetical protein